MENKIKKACERMDFKGEVEISDCGKGKGDLKIISGEKSRCKRIKIKCEGLK